MALPGPGRADQADVLARADPLEARGVVERRLGHRRRRDLEVVAGLGRREGGGQETGPGVGRVARADLGLDAGPQQLVRWPALGLASEQHLGRDLADLGELEPAQSGLEVGRQGDGRGAHRHGSRA